MLADTPGRDRQPLLLQMEAAFRRKADAASILQGVRPFRRGRPHVRIVLVPSPKNGGHFIPCEGRLESAFALSLETDPEVTAYRVQPFYIPSPATGRRLVCDFAVRRCDHSYVVIDVKPSGQLDRPSVLERMRIVRTALAAAGIQHQIATEIDLQRQPFRDSREQLRKGATVSLSSYDCERLLDCLGSQLMPVHALRARAASIGLPPLAIEKLALLGHLTFPLSSPWSEFTLLGAAHGIHHTATSDRGTVQAIRLPL